jgi:hypothetical protein
VLFCFFLFLFGILGVNMFAGKLHFRCTEPGSSEWVDDTAVCATSADCEGEQTCEYYEINPADGALSYDNVLYAFVTIFQAVTLEVPAHDVAHHRVIVGDQNPRRHH